MKKILSIVLVLVMMMTLCSVMSFAEENTSGVLDSGYCGVDGDNLIWTLYKDGELVISGEGDMWDYDAFNAPWTAGYDDTIKTVLVKKGVTSIGDNAFRGLFYATDYSIADSVISIGEYSFGWTSFNHILNSSFREIKIPKSVTYIDNKAFYSSYIERIVIPENITTIKESTFENCTELKTVIVPATVTIVENNAFSNCTEIDTVYFRGTEEQWNNITFGTGNGYLRNAENIFFNAVCHDYESTVIPATCMEKGYTKYCCKICGDEYIDETSYTEKTAHQTINGQCSVCKMFIVEEHEEISLSISLTTDSKVTWSLSNDNAEIISTGSSKVSWGSYVNVTASATIKGISAGSTTLTASVNGNVISTAEIEIVKHEHLYISTVTEPTCTEKGYTTYTCTCGESYIDNYTDSLGGHVEYVVSPERPPTCTTNGYELGSACSICDTIIKVPEYIPPTGHIEEVIAGKTATCTEKGLTEGKKCSVCGEILVTQEEIPATGHDYVAVVTEPTCTEDGFTVYTCYCGDSYSPDEVVPATGHTHGSWEVVVEAQVGADGLEQQKCTVCGEVLDERVIPALPDVSYMTGDANGDGKITAADARIALRISARLDKIENYNLPIEAFDATGDGKLTAADARKILRVAAKIETF